MCPVCYDDRAYGDALRPITDGRAGYRSGDGGRLPEPLQLALLR
jgi:hypothetical protein